MEIAFLESEPSESETADSNDSGIEIIPPSAANTGTSEVLVKSEPSTGKNAVLEAFEKQYFAINEVLFLTHYPTRNSRKPHVLFRHVHRKASAETLEYLRHNPQSFDTIPVPCVFNHDSAKFAWFHAIIDVVSVPIPYSATNQADCECVLFYRVPFDRLPSARMRRQHPLLSAFLRTHSKLQVLCCPP